MRPGDIYEWFANGERGTSSNTIVQRLTGIRCLRGWHESHPNDPGDLRRCVLLLEAYPDLARCFGEMAHVSSEWRRLVDIWPDLIASMDDECPGWRDPNSTWAAPRTYRMMRLAIDGVPMEWKP